MPKPSTGNIVEKPASRGVSYAIRFYVAGKRVHQHVGYSGDGITRADAERALAFELERVRRGQWKPPEKAQAPPPRRDPGFHAFATEWQERRAARGLRPRTIEYQRWALEHICGYFEHHSLAQITVAEVDAYVQAKRREGVLGASSINKTVAVLARVLDEALEYGLVNINTAKGKRRKLTTSPPARPYLEPDQVAALLRAAAELDEADRDRWRIRRPMLATLAYAGLRVGELLALRWGDVDLGNGHLHVRGAKTLAGVRRIDIQPELREPLTEWKMATRHNAPGDLAFPTREGHADGRGSVRRRVLIRSAERANETIAACAQDEPSEWESALVPERLSPHALRRSFASWLVAEGEDPAYVMQQIGHTDPKMTLGLYAKALTSKRRRAQASAQRLNGRGLGAGATFSASEAPTELPAPA